MKTKKRLSAIFVALVFVMGILCPVKVHAADSSYSISVSQTEGSSFNNAGVEVTFYDDYGTISGEYYGISEDNNYTNYANAVVPSETVSVNIKVTSAGQELSKAEVLINDINKADIEELLSDEGQTLAMTVADPLELVFVIGTAGGGNEPAPEPEEGNDIEFDITWVGTDIVVLLEDKEIMGESDQFDLEEYKYSGTVNVNASVTEGDSNLFHFRPRFGDKPVVEYEINGVKYTEGMDGVSVDGDEWWITVPADSHYTIYGVADATASVPRTIIWANSDVNQNAEEYDPDMVLAHGSAKIVAVYGADGSQTQGEQDVDENGMGFAVVEPGSKVVFEFVPEYGYQLTSVQANGFALEAQDTINQYLYTMPDTNVHFAATFTKTEDIVKADSTSVDSGSIVLGGALNGGSAQLTVSDAEVSADKIAGFEKAAGNYKISNYLDIDLYNVFYKGKSDSDDVWSSQITELDSDATVTIKLASGVNAGDVVLVHNIHDGEEYELIELESYDTASNTATFKTRSFSGYAIATKSGTASVSTTATTATTEAATVSAKTQSPNTGDAAPIAAVIVFAVLGMVGMVFAGTKKRS